MTDDIETTVEESLEKSQDELEEELPELLAELDGQTREFVQETPGLFGRLVGRMDDLDVAAFVDENPETADRFQDFLWAGVEVLVENEPDVQSQINQNITVTFEATDCEMSGHLEVDGDEERLRGGAGTVEDPTLEITGPADNLVGLITGEIDPVQGFMSQQYEMDGPVATGTQLAPIMGELAESFD